MSMNIMDKLFEEVEKKGPVCVGLDTDYSYVPAWLAEQYETKGEAVFAFNKMIIDATEDVAGCFKVQIAYYESLGLEGMLAYSKTVKYLRDKGLVVIGDIKRGDIAKTAEMYAMGHFEGDFEVDIVTLSGYMGLDSISPYVPYFKDKSKGAFVLVRTSNPGRVDFQYVETKEGEKIYDVVGKKIAGVGEEVIGEHGYSALGAVIGGTSATEAEEIRAELKNTFFLIPGYGAQGGKAEDIARYLVNGNGGVVNSSRAVLLAYKKTDNDKEFADAVRAEVIRTREEILNACKNYQG